MEEQPQFDDYLGGSQTLPSDVHVLKLLSSRASEIAAMTYSIENPQRTKLVFQKLPAYMRRRVMSHNVKRLPRKLREAHLNQMAKSGLPPKSKRPSRKYRRRPHNLLLEYNRRQRSNIWLETHIWHAKRFHMTKKWGYSIANYANDKCFRANYRAVAKHCLIQDVSYYVCLEITGPDIVLKETLKAHCNPTELTFSARKYITGDREGSLMFYKRNGYPKYPIGYVQFIWRPEHQNVKTIWIWAHPSFVDDISNEIIISFDFKETENTEDTKSGDLAYKNDRDCTMNVLKNGLNRFRLYGPLAINTIVNSLRMPNLDRTFFSKPGNPTPMEIEMQITESPFHETMKDYTTTSTTHDAETEAISKENAGKESFFELDKSWHYEYYSVHDNIESLKIQEQLWQVLHTLQSASQLPPGIVLGFTVLDPRFYLPEKRTKIERQTSTMPRIMPMPPTNVNQSPIWEREIRKNISSRCAPTGAINKLRRQCLVPGVHNDQYFSQDIMEKVPILLIQKPGFNNTGFGSSIDIVLPAGWAMSFWLAFLLRCARVGALRESKSIAFECKYGYSSDINDPDTPAYEREAAITKKELTEKYFRYPPNRRVNFTKLGITSPFFCEWKILMKEWANTEEFFVLRQQSLLSCLQRSLSSLTPNPRQQKNLTADVSNFVTSQIFEHTNCLISVKVSICKKGCPKKFALICIPTKEDVEEFRKNNDWSGPVEKLNADPFEVVRKKSRKNHLMILKRLKRQRIRCKKAIFEKASKIISEDAENLEKFIKSRKLLKPNPEIIQVQRRRMSDLYLPACTKVRNSCDREIMGYVTAGDYSFSEAKGIGIGYVTLDSLLKLINNKYNIVCIRNTQTRQYRMAYIQVLTK